MNEEVIGGIQATFPRGEAMQKVVLVYATQNPLAVIEAFGKREFNNLPSLFRGKNAKALRQLAAGRAVESIARKTNPRHRGPKNCLKGEPVSGNALGAVEDGLEICFTGQRTVGTGPVLPQS